MISAGLLFDYFYNSKTVSVSLHTVKCCDLQEKFTVTGEIFHENNVNYIKSPIKNPLNIKEGAYATVSVDGKLYDGYLRELENLTDGTKTACVSVVCDKVLSGIGDAEVFGSIAQNVVMLPENLIFRDENGKEAVMIARDGYLVKRNIETGEIKNSLGIQITDGLFADEKVVINHTDTKTGNKYK